MQLDSTPIPLPYKPKNYPREYRIWKLMRSRCRNANLRHYHSYGGRGVSVCARWDSFSAFLSDMGPAPSDRHTIDRHPDKYGNYEPGNCRWATRKEQAHNTTANRIITVNGVSRCLAEWADILGLKYSTLEKRIRSGWSIEEAMSRDVFKVGKRRVPAARDAASGKFCS